MSPLDPFELSDEADEFDEQRRPEDRPIAWGSIVVLALLIAALLAALILSLNDALG